jgi:hypothetical protein
MSLQMEEKADNQLVNSVLEFLKRQAEASASGRHRECQPNPVFLAAFRQSFNTAGLDGVDDLITSINNAIKAGGGVAGFGEGAALEHADAEHPAFLHLFFVNFRTDGVLSRLSIPVEP